MNIRDYAIGSVLTPPSPAASGTSLTLQTDEGNIMPAVPFYVTAAPPGVFPTRANSEKLNVTARTNDTLTIERAQGETTAKAIAADWIIANAVFAEDTLGKNTTKWNEPAVGTIDGSNTTFTVDSGQYVAGTLIVTLNGLVQKRTTHYTETTPASGTFTMATAPEAGDNLQVTYDASAAASGNAATLEGLTLTDVYKAIYPVGSVYINASNATNPSTLLGFGTWTAFGAGRVPVGLDSGDTDFDTAEETGGAKTHTLTIAEMPAHHHTLESGGATFRNLAANPFVGGGDSTSPDQDGAMKDTGGGGAHNNLQPYIVVYMWKRTA